MRILEAIIGIVERLHRLLAGAGERLCTFLWRVQSHRSVSFRLAVGFCGLALILVACAFLVSGGYVAACGFDGVFIRYLERAGHLAGGLRLGWACAVGAALCVVAAAFSVVHRRVAFRLMEVAFAAWVVLAVLSFLWLMDVGPILGRADHKAFDSAARNDLWTGILFAAILVVPWAGLLLLALVQKSVRVLYGFAAHSAIGDFGASVLTSFKTGGRDPRWRSSLYYAVTLFLLVLFVPYLIVFWGREEPYGLPKGGGQQVPEVVKVKKVKPKKKPKKLSVNPWSPYILERMDIDDVLTLKELEETTQDTYAASAQDAASRGGKGKGTGGWPKGMEGSAVRFIRLKYRGGDWDQDMGKGADYNLLLKFHEWTGMKIARETEYREIERLKFFPKKKAPPFVFLTGKGNISISAGEAKVLREYCEREGGMLFIDNGGGHFDGSVKNLLRKVFPGKPLVDVPNDDPIYQRPYVFPDGAPPFWHHAGYRAMGIREDGRWLVYYHPGDINDAWRDDHSGASAEVADQAYKLGVNVMFYAFNQYYRRHYEQ